MNTPKLILYGSDLKVIESKQIISKSNYDINTHTTKQPSL